MQYFKRQTNEQVFILQYTGDNLIDLIPFLGNKFLSAPVNGRIQFTSLVGTKTITKGIYLIKNFKADIESCHPDNLNKLYEKR